MNLPGPGGGTKAPPHVVVIGDVVLDREIAGRTERICPDAPVPVLDVTSVRESPGAAGLTALLVAASGARVTLVAPIADDDAGAALVSMLADRMEVVRLGHNGPTRRKTRVRSAGQSLLRIDDGGPAHPTAVPVDALRAALGTADAVLVSDYGAGTTSDPQIRTLLSAAAATTTIVWDPHPRGAPPVEGVTMVTPNLAEALAAQKVSRPAGPDLGGQPDLLAQQLRADWVADATCVTAGADRRLPRHRRRADLLPARPRSPWRGPVRSRRPVCGQCGGRARRRIPDHGGGGHRRRRGLRVGRRRRRRHLATALARHGRHPGERSSDPASDPPAATGR